MPARLSCVSSSLKPKGSTRCSTVFVAAHSRATLPVFGGISGSTKTMFIDFFRSSRGNEAHSSFFSRSLLTSAATRSGIKNFLEHQAVRRGGHAGHAPVFFGQHPPDFIRREFAQPDLHQRADNTPAHFVEKSVAFDDEGQLRAALFDVATRELAHGGF